MKRHELIVIGAGPAGLSAAIEAKKNGMDVVVFDENQRPGGQLFKQIHKFFGSKEHHAKTRGFIIGQQLLKEAEDLGVRVELDSTVMGIYENKEVTVKQNGEVHHYKGDAIIIATGAAENMIPFKGYGKFQRLDSSGCYRCRCGTDHDEHSGGAAGQQDPHGRLRQRGTGRQLPAAASRL